MRSPRSADRREAVRDRHPKRALAAITLAAFVLGTAELVVVGVLDLIAADLGVSVATGGLLVTAYAAGIALGGPLLTAATLGRSRRAVLCAALAAYLAGNLIAALASSFELILIARGATGALHGLIVGAAFALVTSLVPAERAGRAIAAVFGGIALSAAIGVPLGTLLGHVAGWQATFAAIVALGAAALASVITLVPTRTGTATPAPASGRAQAKHALAPPVLAVLAVGFLLLGGQFAALTYLANHLTHITGVPGSAVTVFLLCFGAANTAGTILGGRVADWNAARTLVGANVVLVLALAILAVAGDRLVLTALALGVWGLVGFGLVPSLQHRVVTLAGPGAEFAATLPASAVTAGIAVGSIAGGWAVSHDADTPVQLAAAICAAALPITWATGRLGRTHRPVTPAPVAVGAARS